jgi:Outer membrane protein beta-barrel domain
MLLLAGQVFGQRMHHFDIRPFNLGFTMGLNYSGYNMTVQNNQYDEASNQLLKSVELVRKPGIYLGLITNMKLHNNIDLRFLPAVSLEERDFIFNMDTAFAGYGEPIVRKKIEASYLNLPLVLKFKSNYYRRVRVWTQFGIQPAFNLSSNKKVRNDPDLLKIQDFDVAFFASFGVDLYGERLKLSPELRFTNGLRNLYVQDRTRFPFAISDLLSQVLVFNINFE